MRFRPPLGFAIGLAMVVPWPLPGGRGLSAWLAASCSAHRVPTRPCVLGTAGPSAVLRLRGAGEAEHATATGGGAASGGYRYGNFCLMPREHDSGNDEQPYTSYPSAHTGEHDVWEHGGQLFRGEEEESYADYDGHEYCGEDAEGVHQRGRTRSDEQLEDGPVPVPRSGSPWGTIWGSKNGGMGGGVGGGGGGGGATCMSNQHVSTSASGALHSLRTQERFDYGPEEDFVLHLPPSIVDERDPAEEPDASGALAPVDLCDDRGFYGVSPAWEFRDDMADGTEELIARRRLRRKAWDSLVIPWNASDHELKQRIPQFVRQLKEVDPTVDREDVTQAVFKTIMCRDQIKHIHEEGVKVGYDSSLRETVFHPRSSKQDLKTFSGPTRYEDLKRYVKNLREQAAAEHLQRMNSSPAGDST